MYLKQAEEGKKQSWLAPEHLCECCMDVNQINIQRAKDMQTMHPTGGYEQTPAEGTTTAPPVLKPKDKRVHFKGEPEVYQGQIHRSPTPELSDAFRLDPELQKQPQNIFLTHPSKDFLFSEWHLEQERGRYRRDRLMADDVLEASSKLVSSMNKLQLYTGQK